MLSPFFVRNRLADLRAKHGTDVESDNPPDPIRRLWRALARLTSRVERLEYLLEELLTARG